MIQADSVLSTPPTNLPAVPTRRGFLSQAACIAAGGTALGLATPPASAANDPIFALIETHRAQEAALEATIREKGRVEEGGRQFGDSLADAAHQAEKSALLDLVDAVPTTLAGVMASMTYIAGLSDLEWGRIEDDEIGPLLSNLAEALESLAVTS
jgi:hypothetical protein